MRTLALTAALALALALAACHHAAPAGTERGPCYGNGTCNDGLTCASELCVRVGGGGPGRGSGSGSGSATDPPPGPGGADCARIAEHLGYLLLDNYAPRPERARFGADLQARCRSQGLTERDAACLLAAKSRQAIGACPRPLGVGDCHTITAHLRGLLPSGGTDQYLVTSADRIISRCRNEVPSKALEACALAAKTVADVDGCTW
jgi:hypothetical protein